MGAFKVVGRHRKKEEQEIWLHGKPFTQAKKRVYVDKCDFEKYSPELIRRWSKFYIVEIYEKIDKVWINIKQEIK